MNIYRIIGDNVRGFRNKKGWTQEKLATRAELNANYVGCIERAERKLSIDTLLKIAKLLKVKPSRFLDEDAYKVEEGS